jgi:hypothetical protein
MDLFQRWDGEDLDWTARHYVLEMENEVSEIDEASKAGKN